MRDYCRIAIGGRLRIFRLFANYPATPGFIIYQRLVSRIDARRNCKPDRYGNRFETEIYLCKSGKSCIFEKRLVKYYLSIPVLTFSVLLFGYIQFTKPIHLNGRLENAGGSPFGSLPVFIKTDKEILGKTITDENGNFQLSFAINGKNTTDLYFVLTDTLLITSFTSFQKDTMALSLIIPIRKRNTMAQIICPKCEKSDKVRKFDYAGHNSDTAYLNTVRLANLYFCDRDQVKF
jgi:hypothetical protein